MLQVPYSVALITRGTGAYAYTYSGPPGLPRGQVCAVGFHNRFELGLVLGPDPDPPSVALRALWPVEVSGHLRWGELLLDLCELSISAPDEIAGHLLFAAPSTGLKLALSIEQPDALSPLILGEIGPLTGSLSAPRRKALVASKHWAELATLAGNGALRITASIAGTPAVTRGQAAWRKVYRLDESTASLLGLDTAGDLPGNYLAGFDGLLARAGQGLPVVRTPAEVFGKLAAVADGRGNMVAEWSSITWPPDWNLPCHWPRLKGLELRQRFATWFELRQSAGLPAELAAELVAGRNVLVIAPQVWMIERLWPQLVRLAGHVSRFRAESGPSAASSVLHELGLGGHAVLAGPGGWKLAAYFRFDRIIVLDPSHPQYAAEHTPHLDPRLALMVSAPDGACIDFLNLGLSFFDGASPAVPVHIHSPHEPVVEAHPGALAPDSDPLPLELRRPDRRRLIYFNRLGSGRGLFCAECWAKVACPRCGSAAIHYSMHASAYVCPDCGLSERDLRCARCGLMTLAAVLPGLESVALRPGDVVVHGPAVSPAAASSTQAVLGTSQLLDPLAGFWPQEIIYVHAEGQVGLTADWPQALDMALRLRALYDNPQLESVHVVSERLMEQFGPLATAGDIASQWQMELGLRELGGLPPFGTLYHLRLVAARSDELEAARHELGATLHGQPATALLRLGKPYRSGGWRLGAWLVNDAVSLRELQELRWRLHRLGATLAIHAMHGPWL